MDALLTVVVAVYWNNPTRGRSMSHIDRDSSFVGNLALARADHLDLKESVVSFVCSHIPPIFSIRILASMYRLIVMVHQTNTRQLEHGSGWPLLSARRRGERMV